MLKMFLKYFIVVLMTSMICVVVFTAKNMHMKAILLSSVKAPVRMALKSIDEDIESGRTEMAKNKLKILIKEWAEFSEGNCLDNAPGDIMVRFGAIENKSKISGFEPVIGEYANKSDSRKVFSSSIIHSDKDVIPIESRLRSKLDIKLVIYQSMIKRGLVKDDERKKTCYLMMESDFKDIEKQLKFNGIILKAGNYSEAEQKEIDSLNKVNSIRNMISPIYGISDYITYYQIENFSLPKDNSEIEIYCQRYSDPLSASGYIYIFKHKDDYWFLVKVSNIWLS